MANSNITDITGIVKEYYSGQRERRKDELGAALGMMELDIRLEGIKATKEHQASVLGLQREQYEFAEETQKVENFRKYLDDISTTNDKALNKAVTGVKTFIESNIQTYSGISMPLISSGDSTNVGDYSKAINKLLKGKSVQYLAEPLTSALVKASLPTPDYQPLRSLVLDITTMARTRPQQYKELKSSGLLGLVIPIGGKRDKDAVPDLFKIERIERQMKIVESGLNAQDAINRERIEIHQNPEKLDITVDPETFKIMSTVEDLSSKLDSSVITPNTYTSALGFKASLDQQIGVLSTEFNKNQEEINTLKQRITRTKELPGHNTEHLAVLEDNLSGLETSQVELGDRISTARINARDMGWSVVDTNIKNLSEKIERLKSSAATGLPDRDLAAELSKEIVEFKDEYITSGLLDPSQKDLYSQWTEAVTDYNEAVGQFHRMWPTGREFQETAPFKQLGWIRPITGDPAQTVREMERTVRVGERWGEKFMDWISDYPKVEK
tara:strand:+ start:674 stop:2167 length:1494 start_codon:yes stop_codon:yes gene_type:complete